MKRTLTTLALLLTAAPVLAQGAPTMTTSGSHEVPGAGWTRSDVRRYWPEDRRRHSRNERRDRAVNGWFEVRGGFYDAQDVTANDWTIGMKVTGRVAPSIQAGIATDLHRRSEAQRTITSQYVDATGHTVTTTSTTAEAESNLLPLMGVLEFHMPAPGLDPYFGAAAGWEFLNVRVRDFGSGIGGEANYDGPGYQLFGGVGLPLGPRARLTGEAYWNGATVKRNVIDSNSGYLVEERVNVDGGGARVGLGFAF
ncbi:MAG: hypothetical protein ABI960_11650 [Candidatus Eisenbacteria bacterium]